MKYLAVSAIFIQPDTRPFRFVVYQTPHRPGFVCHWQYVDQPGHYEHGVYGDAVTCLTSFAVRTSSHHGQTIACGGTVDADPLLHYERQPR